MFADKLVTGILEDPVPEIILRLRRRGMWDGNPALKDKGMRGNEDTGIDFRLKNGTWDGGRWTPSTLDS